MQSPEAPDLAGGSLDRTPGAAQQSMAVGEGEGRAPVRGSRGESCLPGLALLIRRPPCPPGHS